MAQRKQNYYSSDSAVYTKADYVRRNTRSKADMARMYNAGQMKTQADFQREEEEQRQRTALAEQRRKLNDMIQGAVERKRRQEAQNAATASFIMQNPNPGKTVQTAQIGMKTPELPAQKTSQPLVRPSQAMAEQRAEQLQLKKMSRAPEAAERIIGKTPLEQGKGPQVSIGEAFDRMMQNRAERAAATKASAESFSGYMASLGENYKKGQRNVTPENVAEYLGTIEQNRQAGKYDISGDTSLHSNAQKRKDAQIFRQEAEDWKQEVAEKGPKTDEERRALQMQAEQLGERRGLRADELGLDLYGTNTEADFIHKRPDDYYEENYRDEYDEKMYDYFYGEGAYYDRLMSMQTDSDVDRLEAELDDMWDRLESKRLYELDKADSNQPQIDRITNLLTGDTSAQERKAVKAEEEAARADLLEELAGNAPAAQAFDESAALLKGGAVHQAALDINSPLMTPENSNEKNWKDEWFLSDKPMAEYGGRSEKDIFNGYYQAERYDEAMEFLEALRPTLQARKAKAREYVDRENARYELFGMNIGGLAGLETAIQKPVGAAAEAVDLLGSMFGVEGSGDLNSVWHQLGNSVRNVRDERGNIWDEAVTAWFGQDAAGWGKKFNGALYSILDNVVAMGAGKGLTTAIDPETALKQTTAVVQWIMSTGAAADEFAEKTGNGMAANEAAVYAIGSGVIEAITEKYSIEALLGADVKEMLGNGREMLAFLGKNMFTEGTEEVASDVLGMVMDDMMSAINGHESEFRQRVTELTDEGINETDAIRQAMGETWQKFGESFLFGGLSGLVLSGGRMAANEISNFQTGSRIRNTDKYMQDGQSGERNLMQQAAKLGTESKSAALAEQMEEDWKKGKNVSRRRLGRLTQNIQMETQEQAQQAAEQTIEETAKQAMMDAGVQEETAAELAPTVKKAAMDGIQTLSQDERRALRENRAAAKAAEELTKDSSLTRKVMEQIREKTKDLQSIAETTENLAEGKTAEGLNPKSAGEQLATQDEIRQANGERTGGAREAIVDGEFGTVEGITDDGKVEISTGSGTKNVDVSEVKATNFTTAAILRERAVSPEFYGQGYTNTLLKQTQQGNIQNVGRYLQDAYKIRWAAYLGQQMPETGINRQQAEELYLTSREDATKEWQAAQQERKANYRGAGNGRVTLNGAEYGNEAYNKAVESLAPEQRERMAYVADIAKASGIELTFIDTSSPDYAENVHGFENGGGITINLDSYDSRQAKEEGRGHHIVVTMSHEMTHWLQRNNAQGYLQLQDFVLQRMADEGVNVAARAESLMNQRKISMTEAIDEIVANACDQVLGNREVAEQLQKENKGLYQAIKGFVKKLIKRIKGVAVGMEDSASRDAQKIMYKYGNELAKIWLGAYDEVLTGKIAQAEAGGDITKMSQAELDEAYLQAVKDNNTELMQQMVDEAAKRAGYTEVWAHGSRDASFTMFNFDKATGAKAIFLSDIFTASNYTDASYYPVSTRLIGKEVKTVDDALAEIKRINKYAPEKVDGGYKINKDFSLLQSVGKKDVYSDEDVITYANKLRSNKKGGTYNLYVNTGNKLTVDAKEKYWNEINSEYGKTTDQIADRARFKGYDSVQINNVYDGDHISSDVLVVFDGNKVKSAELVVYDDNGNVIPLSERFNKESNDIRFSTAELDEEYADAVESGNWKKAEQMLLDKYVQQAGKGLIGYRAGYNYGGEHADIARLIKSGEDKLVQAVAKEMAVKVPDNAVIVPMPPHSGKVTEGTDTMILARAISKITGRPVLNALESEEHISRNQAKKQGIRGVDAKSLGFRKIAKIPADAMPVFIDNVVGGGVTAKAAHDAVGRGITLAYAQSPRGKISGAKNLIVTYDSNGKLIPLSQRMDPNVNSWKYSMAEMSLADLEQAYEDAYNAYDDDTGEKVVAEMAERAFPDSKVRDKNGRLKVVYHQTNADPFTVFDMEKARQTEDVAGAFFAPEFDRYHEYGDRTYAVYLNITNPKYDVYDMDLSKENAGRMKREELIAQGYDGVINTEDGKVIEYVAFYPEQIKSAEAFTEDDDGDLINLIQRFNKWKKDYRYSMSEDQMDINAWMMAQTPGKFQTEHERKLLEDYKGLRVKISLSLMRQSEYERQIRQLERNENPTWDDREKLTTLRNKLGIQQDKQARLEQELYEITSDRGYAKLMYQGQRLYADYVEGKTQAQVEAAVDSLLNEAAKAEKSIKRRQAELERMAENNPVRTIIKSLNNRGLGRTVDALRTEYATAMEENELKGRLAEIILKRVNGEDTAEDIRDMAQDVVSIQQNRAAEEANDALKQLRGMTVVIGQEQQKELKATNSGLREIQRATRGSGIKFVYGDHSSLDSNWQEISDDIVSMRNQLDNDKDSINAFVDYVKGLLDLRTSDKNEYGVDVGDVEAFITASVNLVLNNEAGGLTTEQLAKKIRKSEGALDKALASARETAKTAEDLLAGAKKAAGWAGIMRQDVQATIDYYNETAKQAAQVEKQNVRKSLIETLKSEHTKELIQQEQEFNERMKKDRKARELAADNESVRRQITTVAKRLKNLLTAETDEKNVTEEAKPLARVMTGLLVQHDISGFRRVLYTDRKSLEDFSERLRKMEAAGEPFDPQSDLDWLVVHANNPEDNDYTMRDRVLEDLDAIKEGLQEYRQAEGNGNTSLQERQDALKKVQEAVNEIYSVIRARSSVFIEGRRVSVLDLAEDMRRDMENSRFKGDRRLTKNLIKLVGYGNMTPEYFFKNLRNGAMNELHKGLHEAENTGGLQAEAARKVIEQIAKETGYATWDPNEKHTIRVKGGQQIGKDANGQPVVIGGNTLELTTEQLMALYATWQRERNQMRPEQTAHLLNGGFVLAKDEKPGLMERVKENSRPSRMTVNLLDALAKELTPQQKEYVDRIVKYMSTDLAELGNETSMKEYGIKKFTEQYYFPIKSWGGVLNKSSDSGITNKNDVRAMRQSFLKRVQAGASNAIEIGDFTATAMKHIVGMINFNTVGPAVENINRVLNQQLEYGEKTADEDNTYRRNMRAAFQEAYGENALKYLEQFMQDVNGGTAKGVGNTPIDRLLSTFKKNAVAGSLSVAAQQPLSYIRAAMMINPKYLAEALSPAYYKGSYQEMMDHSGVAVIKQMGKFDMAYGRSMIDWITPEAKKSAGKKVVEQISDKSTILPQLMDNMTWTRMWSACKIEQHRLHPDMDMKSDAFLDMVGERFNEVMRRTQVYDSVLVKSQNMRSTHWFAKTMTSFMAEPTLSLNVLADAWQNIRSQGGGKTAVKALGTFVVSAALQAAAKAVFSTGRSPDKKKNLEENYLYKLVYNLISELNPLGLIPGYNSIIETLENGELTDNSMSVIAKAKEATENLMSLISGAGNKTEYRKVEDSFGQLLQLSTNVPVKNIMRDFRAIVNLVSGGAAAGWTGNIIDDRETSQAVLKYQARDLIHTEDLFGLINKTLGDAGYKTTKDAYIQRMYDAKKAGNKQEAEEIEDYLLKVKISGSNPAKTMRDGLNKLTKADDSLTAEQKIEMLEDNGYSGVGSYVLDQLKKGKIDRKTAEKLYREENPEADDKDVLKALDKQTYKGKLAEGQQNYTNYTPLYVAMEDNSVQQIRDAIQYMVKNGYTEKDIKTQVNSRIREQYQSADSNKKISLRNAMQIAYKALGFTAQDADKTIEGWKKSKKNTVTTTTATKTSTMPKRPGNDQQWDKYMDELDEYWYNYDFAKNDPVGRWGKGTIDLNNRIVVHNADGSISTDLSYSFWDEDEGKEILIPLIVNGKKLTEKQAVEHYYQTVKVGRPEYFGKFNNWKDADEYSMMLHNRNNWYYSK